MTLSELNTLDPAAARRFFSQTCAAQRWVIAMEQNRPFADFTDLCAQAVNTWQQMGQSDVLEAFEAHPMIGNMASLRAKFASTKTLASDEQAGASQADEQTLLELQRLNKQYLAKNGFIFIVCASGLSAKTMLEKLRIRIDNPTEQEIDIAAGEQLKITLLRLTKGIEQ